MEQDPREVKDFMDYLIRNFRRGQAGMPLVPGDKALSVDPFMARQAISVLINSVGPHLKGVVENLCS